MKKLLKKLLAPLIREVIREEEKHRKVTDWKEIEKKLCEAMEKAVQKYPSTE